MELIRFAAKKITEMAASVFIKKEIFKTHVEFHTALTLSEKGVKNSDMALCR